MLASGGKQHAPVSLLVLVLAAAALGFLLILLIGRGQRVSPAAPESARLAAVTDLAWVRDHGIEGFERILLALFAEMGFEPQPGERTGGTVAFCAVDPTPIRGGRIYVHGVLAPEGVPVDGDEVRALLDASRAESAGKAVLVTIGRFTDDARETAKDNPIDLLDGDELAALVRKHLPQAWATRTA